MAKRPLSSYVRHTVFGLLSFILCVLLFFLSLATVLSVTLFNSSDFLFDSMNSSNYFNDKADEITEDLTDLGYASGLKEEFFDGLINGVMLSNDTQNYLESYYNGEGTKIDTTEFKQTFNAALDKYIDENNIKVTSAASRDNLVNKAAAVYKNSLEIPFFSSLSSYFLAVKAALPFVIGGLIFFIAVICVVFFLANKWKHRAVKYIYYGVAGAFLTVGVIPTIILLSGVIAKINLESRALYNLFVQYSEIARLALVFVALFFLLVAIALYIQYRRMHRKVS